MEITYNPTRTITTADLFIACDPPIFFEVKVRLTPEWAIKSRTLDEAGNEDFKVVSQLMSEAFVSVSQNGDRYPLNSVKAVQDLCDSIEADNEGYGQDFIKSILEMFSNNHFRFLAEASRKSVLQSGQSSNNASK